MTAYDTHFYNAIREGCRNSANACVPLLVEHLGLPESVLDVGCGEGWWGEAFRLAGVPDVVGLENGEAQPDLVGFPILDVDITQPFNLPGMFDVAVCLEVAEHLPESAADHLVASLCRMAETVIFSAAIPCQVGTGHINCQPPAYWGEKFAALGYGCDDRFRLSIWNDPRIESWYKGNILIFRQGLRSELPLYLIHPEIWRECP